MNKQTLQMPTIPYVKSFRKLAHILQKPIGEIHTRPHFFAKYPHKRRTQPRIHKAIVRFFKSTLTLKPIAPKLF